MFFADAGNEAYMLRAGVNAIQAIHQAMAEGSTEPSTWLDGLYFVSVKLGEEVDTLEKLLNAEQKRHNNEGRNQP